MKEIKEIIRATALAALPLMALMYLLLYFIGGVSLYEVLEQGVLTMLIIVNLLILLHRLIPGGVRKWLTIFVIAVAAITFYPGVRHLDMSDSRLFFIRTLGILLLLNIIIYFIFRKPEKNLQNKVVK